MEIKGKIIHVLPLKNGTSSKGEWQSQQYVLETQENYPKKFLFDVFGKEKIEKFALKENDIVTVSFDPSAKEYNGSWYGSNHAWNVTHQDSI